MKGEIQMIRIDYMENGSCRVKRFKTQKDADSFLKYIAQNPRVYRVVAVEKNNA